MLGRVRQGACYTESMATLEEIRSQVLALGPDERAGLIEDLLASLGPTNYREIASAWVDEGERRLDAYASGAMATVSLEESRRRVLGP